MGEHSEKYVVGKKQKKRLSEAEIVLLAQEHMSNPPRWRQDLLYRASYDNQEKVWWVDIRQIFLPTMRDILDKVNGPCL